MDGTAIDGDRAPVGSHVAVLAGTDTYAITVAVSIDFAAVDDNISAVAVLAAANAGSVCAAVGIDGAALNPQRAATGIIAATDARTIFTAVCSYDAAGIDSCFTARQSLGAADTGCFATTVGCYIGTFFYCNDTALSTYVICAEDCAFFEGSAFANAGCSFTTRCLDRTILEGDVTAFATRTAANTCTSIRTTTTVFFSIGNPT